MKSYRIDQGRLDKAQMTHNGYLKADCFATRVGVFKYKMADGSMRRELRCPEEVFRDDSLSSLANVPVTNDHPTVMLDSKNTKKYICGFTDSHVGVIDKYVATRVTLIDQEAIDAIQKENKQEMSCGYECSLDETSGIWENEPYDAIQRNIIYNHVALVDRGRAGANVKLYLDSIDSKIDNVGVMIRMDEDYLKNSNKNDILINVDSNKKEDLMVKFKIDNIEYEASEGVAKLATDLKEKVDCLESAAKELNSKLDSTTGEIVGLKTSLKDKENEIIKLKDSKPSTQELVKLAKDRADLEDFARKSLKDDELKTINFDSDSDLDIKKAIIKSRCDLDITKESEDTINGIFKGLKINFKTDSAIQLEKDIKNTKHDKEVSANDVRSEQMKKTKEAWNNKK